MYIGNEPLDLALTLIESAQCFRWTQRGERFGAVVDGAPVWIWREDDGLYAQCADAQRLRDYLDLERDYGLLAREYGRFPIARQAVEMYPGLRVLNQNPWDALVTFILSANNNVGRIRKLCDALAERFGETFDTPDGRLCGLPSPERLAACSEEELRGIGAGYRAPYLIQTARRVAEGFPLDRLSEMEYGEAHSMLVQLAGVGDKVADCVLLFGCRHASAFPVDVWVEKLLREWFGIETKGRAQLGRVSREMLGEHAGLLQQFLFHAARTGGIPVGQGKNREAG